MEDISFENFETRPDIFPVKWSCKNITRDDVERITGKINSASQLVTKSRLNSSYWTKNSLDRLIQSFHEAWNYNDEMIICVWEANQKENEPPLGFISFHFWWQETKTKRISYLALSLNLIWVRPDKRGLGGTAARHIVSHLIFYLQNCKFVSPYVSVRGVDVTLHADFDSLGGEKVSNIIEENLMFMKDIKLWKIREVVFKGGY
jgi:hypothetical protein